MRQSTFALFSMLVALMLAGCDFPRDQDDWKNVITASANECPDIAGTYSIADQPAYIMLGGHYEEQPKDWGTISIAGNPQESLHITLYEAGSGVSSEKPISRIRNKDYQCQEGWLVTEWPYRVLPTNRAEDGIPNDNLFEKSLSFAKNTSGDLVMRTTIRHWQGISVWCGDGCKYIPIPFTSHRLYQWSRWPSSSIPVRSPFANASSATDIIADEVVYTPTDETAEAGAARVLKKAIPAGGKLIALTKKEDYWQATIQGDANALIGLNETLLSSAAVQILNVAITPISSPMKNMVIDLRFINLASARTLKQAEEAANREKAIQQQAEDKALVKRLLPSLPADMVITATQHDAYSFLVEVRHKDDAAFDQLIANAVNSGEFISAEIKAKKSVDGYGKRIVDILFVPRQ